MWGLAGPCPRLLICGRTAGAGPGLPHPCPSTLTLQFLELLDSSGPLEQLLLRKGRAVLIDPGTPALGP